ncbi:MAG TPA: hypothetical protein VNI77_06240 [Nitrososphaera sp.]|nr:hypothetical protein [Nitrososphaera sp.]
MMASNYRRNMVKEIFLKASLYNMFVEMKFCNQQSTRHAWIGQLCKSIA